MSAVAERSLPAYTTVPATSSLHKEARSGAKVDSQDNSSLNVMVQKMEHKRLAKNTVKRDLKPFDVAIAGEINLDLILYGLPEHMPVERELLASDFRLTLGSSSAIVAHNLASLGSKVTFTTLVGPDELGRVALE